jgi:hypothetical protein
MAEKFHGHDHAILTEILTRKTIVNSAKYLKKYKLFQLQSHIIHRV